MWRRCLRWGCRRITCAPRLTGCWSTARRSMAGWCGRWPRPGRTAATSSSSDCTAGARWGLPRHRNRCAPRCCWGSRRSNSKAAITGPPQQRVVGLWRRPSVRPRCLCCATLAWQAMIATVAGERDTAGPLLERAVEVGRAAGDGGALAAARLYQGLLALLDGDVASALTYLRDAEAGLRMARRAFLLAQVLIELGRTELVGGEQASARGHLTEGLRLARDLKSPFLSAMGLEAVAALLVSEGDLERGLELGAAAKASRSALGVTMPPVYDAVIDGLLSPARRRLGAQSSARCLRRGAAVPLATAVDRALGSPHRGEALTRRQQEVAELVTAGLTNRDIAARLHLSVRTVEDHVESILDRLGFDRRSQIAAYMIQGDLVETP